MTRVLSFLIRYFSNYYTLHRSDLAARAAPLDPRLPLIWCPTYPECYVKVRKLEEIGKIFTTISGRLAYPGIAYSDISLKKTHTHGLKRTARYILVRWRESHILACCQHFGTLELVHLLFFMICSYKHLLVYTCLRNKHSCEKRQATIIFFFFLT